PQWTGAPGRRPALADLYRAPRTPPDKIQITIPNGLDRSVYTFSDGSESQQCGDVMSLRASQFSALLGLTEEHEAVGDLAFRIAGKYAGASLRDRDAQDAYWKELVGVGFAGMSLPETYGGGGQGLLELCVVTERSAAAGYPAGRLVLSQG